MKKNNLLKTKLVKYIETGDELLLDENVLRELKGFILHMCGSWIRSGVYTDEELYEMCLFNIGVSLKKYDPSKGEITTYLGILCKRAIMHDQQNRKAQKRINEYEMVSLNETVFEGENSSKSIKYEDTVLIHYDEFKFIDYEKYVLKACENIENNITQKRSKMSKENLLKLFIMNYQGYTHKIITKELKISHAQSSRKLKKIREETQRLMKLDKVI